MMTKIIRVLTAIKRINEVISKQVLALAIKCRLNEHKRINRSIKESKEFNVIIRYEKESTMHSIKHKQARGKCLSIANSVENAHEQQKCPASGRADQGVGK